MSEYCVRRGAGEMGRGRVRGMRSRGHRCGGSAGQVCEARALLENLSLEASLDEVKT